MKPKRQAGAARKVGGEGSRGAPAVWPLAGAVLLATLLVYANSFGAGFAFDSRGLILDDARVHAWTAANLAQIWQHTYWWPVGESGLYRPLATVSYLFNWAVLGNGDSAGGYHAINFLLHATNVLLVWLLARRFWNERWPPALIAAVWAVHPVLTESVTNVAGRADLLAGAALLGGFLFYLNSKQDKRWLIPLMAITAVGVFSKESAVTIVGVIVLYEVACRTDDRLVSSVRGCAAVAPPILFMLYQRSTVLSASAPAEFPFTDNPLIGAGFWTGRLGALNVVGRYIGLLVWPAQLSCDYSYAQIPVSGGVWEWALLAATAAFLIWRRSRTSLFLAGAAFLVFLPSSNLIFPIGSIMAERFLYLPSIAFAAAIVWAVYAIQPRRAPAILGVVIALFALRTFVRNTDWQDDLTLSDAAVRVCPASFKTHKMRANALLESDPSHGNLDKVIQEAEKSLAILDGLPATRNNFDTYQRAAEYHFMQGDRSRQTSPAASRSEYQRAVDLYRRSLTMAKLPTSDVYQQLAKLYLRLSQSPQALDAALRARDTAPADPAVHRTLAGVLLDAGRDEDAVAAMVAGVTITRDEALRQELLRMYRAGLDPAGCAVSPDGSLNSSCVTVHRNLCAAAPDIVRLRPDLTALIKSSGCQ